MFIGAINQKLRQFFWEHAPALDGREIYIGCSGNFTVEQIITRRAPNARICSNDVALYSSLVGYALMGRELALEVLDSEYSWLRPYLDRGGAEKVSVFLLLMEMLKFEKQATPFSRRMWDTYYLYWEKHFGATLERVKKAFASIRIQEYSTVDVHDYFPRDGVSIGFLPTYVGGYEKLYKRIDEIFRWESPRYELLTQERRDETIRRMTAGDYILYDDCRRDELPCVARVDQFGKKAVYIYSNLPFDKGLFRRKMGEKVPAYPILGLDEEIPDGARLSIVATDNATINHYRHIYLKKGIEISAGDKCFMVFAGGKLFGFLIYKAYSKKGERGTVYLLSDFVVTSRRHKRLSKLLLLVSVSREMKQTLEEALVSRVKAVLTTAFTDKPVSMKYRGIYELVKRGEGYLNYRAEFKNDRIEEAIRIWKTKYEKQ